MSARHSAQAEPDLTGRVLTVCWALGNLLGVSLVGGLVHGQVTGPAPVTVSAPDTAPDPGTP